MALSRSSSTKWPGGPMRRLDLMQLRAFRAQIPWRLEQPIEGPWTASKISIEVLGIAQLDELAWIHYPNPIAEVFDD
ncbi:hypothetical protein ACFIOY_18970 [Bradyrhizobium sp. TZ2]